MIVENEYTVKLSEIRKNNEATNKAILSYLEDIGGIHSNKAGYGILDIPETHLTWLLLEWKLNIIRRPNYNEKIKIKTWSSHSIKFYSFREFEVYDEQKNLIAIASSKWILVNTESGKLTRVEDYILDKYEPEKDKLVFETDEFEKIKEPKEYKLESEYKVKRADIDVNNHMHNLNYLELANEALPEDIYKLVEFNNVRITYKKEIKLGETVKCKYGYEDNKHIIIIKSEDDKTLHAMIDKKQKSQYNKNEHFFVVQIGGFVMITTLHIKNIGIISDLEINLNKGMNVLTGETGAGKTLIIDSLGIICGGRFSKEMIRKGENHSYIEICIYAPKDENAIEGNIIVTREIYSSGRNMCKINGRLVTVTELKEFMSNYIEIHGQNDNQQLLDNRTHIKYLDNFVGEQIQRLKEEYKIKYNKYNEIKRKLRENYGDEKEKQRKLDLLRYQLNEIEEAKLKEGEEEKLEEKRKKIMNSEKISKNLSKHIFFYPLLSFFAIPEDGQSYKNREYRIPLPQYCLDCAMYFQFPVPNNNNC